jgi:hypothetical protein
MFSFPSERSVRIPFAIGLFAIALGFFFFESYGAFLGFFEDDIVAWQVKQIRAHPEITQNIEREAATPEQAAGKAWERIKFLHGHGYVMVLASFVFLVLIANAPMVTARIKAGLMWANLAAMVLYNVGWGLAGWLVPFMGAEPAKELAEWIFFAPFGITIVAITGFIALAYGREALACARRSPGV